jgi:hypothetical protein
MSCGTAMWSAPLGGAVTHSPSVGSRSGCGAQLWAALGGTLEGKSRKRRGGRPIAGIERLPLLANSGSHCVFPCICVSPCHEGCHRCVSECWRLSVEALIGCGCMRVPVRDALSACQRHAGLLLETVYSQPNLVIQFTLRGGVLEWPQGC